VLSFIDGWLYGGKKNAVMRGQESKSGSNAAFVWQHVENNSFHLSKMDRLLRKMLVRLGPMAKVPPKAQD